MIAREKYLATLEKSSCDRNKHTRVHARARTHTHLKVPASADSKEMSFFALGHCHLIE